MIPGTTRNYTATANVNAFTLVKPGANDGEVVPAAAVGDEIFGLSTGIDVTSGEPCDVIHEGIGYCKLGGGVTRGNWITTDASGLGVAAAPAAGANASVVGKAIQSGVSGDVIQVIISLGKIQG